MMNVGAMQWWLSASSTAKFMKIIPQSESRHMLVKCW